MRQEELSSPFSSSDNRMQRPRAKSHRGPRVVTAQGLAAAQELDLQFGGPGPYSQMCALARRVNAELARDEVERKARRAQPRRSTRFDARSHHSFCYFHCLLL